MNKLTTWISNNRLMVLFSLIIIVAASTMMFIFHIVNTNADQVTDTTGESGGAGEPTKQSLVLEGWDTPIFDNFQLAEALSTDAQNHVVTMIADHYLEKFPTKEITLYGKITNVHMLESSDFIVLFTVTVHDTVYSVTFDTYMDELLITDSSGIDIAYRPPDTTEEAN